MTDETAEPEAGDGEGAHDAREPRDARPGLTRSRRLKVIGGVCGGLGRYVGVDPVIFRVVLAVLALTGGVGLIAYGIGWLLIPMEGEDDTELHRMLSGRIEGPALSALLCALVGSGLFLSTIDNGANEAFSLCLMAAAVGAVYWSLQRRKSAAAAGSGVGAGARTGPEGEAYAGASATASDAPPAVQPPPTGTPSWWRTTSAPTSTTGYLWGPADGASDAQETYDDPGRHGYERERPRTPRPPRRERSSLGAYTALLALAAASIAASVSWKHHPLGTTLEITLVAALAVLGLGLIVSAFAGRRAGGTVFLALLTTALLAGAASLPKSVGTDWTRVVWRPAGPAQVQPEYRLGAGEAQLDLTAPGLTGSTVTATVDVGAGRLLVLTPQNATVRLNAQVGLGDLALPELGRHTVNVSPHTRRSLTLSPPDGTKSSSTITLNLKLGVGQVEVNRGSLPGPAPVPGPARRPVPPTVRPTP